MSSYLSIVIFVLITIFYYIALKLPISVAVLEDTTGNLYKQVVGSNYIRLAIYFALVILSQFSINISMIINQCGGSILENIGAGALMTFIPWIFIFGMVIIVLILFPGFKSAFSNVIGYFIVAGAANNIFSKLLENSDIHKAIANDPTLDENKKQEFKNAAEAIVKMCGNLSVLINQITPFNFTEYWNLLLPLMKPEFQQSNGGIYKQQLLDIVTRRDDVGEALWYIYTAIFLTSVIQFNFTTKGCNQNLASMKAAHDAYLTQDKADAAALAKQQSTVYTKS
jgi:ABC-type multidrug transport system fused ATPase/permease subunit